MTTERYVRRSRLYELLTEAARAPLTLVVAPAGAGKTTLAAGWVAESTAATAWLSLDDTDRDAGQFWWSVVLAMRTLVPGCGERTLAVLRRQGTLAEAVGELLDELDELEGPASFFVVDDAQVVGDDDRIAASLSPFARHLPAWLHVVLLSRLEPRLPLDRLRARGQLGEVRFAELRFTRHEAREMLARLAVSLPDDRLDAITERTEGWAAGVQLAALTARSSRAQRGFEAPILRGDSLIHDYVLREVLDVEAPELVSLLLDIAVVDRTNASLAVALTGRERAGGATTAIAQHDPSARPRPLGLQPPPSGYRLPPNSAPFGSTRRFS